MKRLSKFPAKGAALFAVIFVSFCMVVWGATHGYAQQKRACADDIAKYCKDVKPGKGDIIKCLQENEGKLSGDCKKKLEESRKRLESAENACAADVKKFCKDVKPGMGRISECLKEHANEVSSECREKCDTVKEKK